VSPPGSRSDIEQKSGTALAGDPRLDAERGRTSEPTDSRQLKEIVDRDGSTIAAEGPARIAALYRIEAEIRGRPSAERLAVREARSRPIVEAFGQWLGAQRARVSHKFRIGEKPTYIADPQNRRSPKSPINGPASRSASPTATPKAASTTSCPGPLSQRQAEPATGRPHRLRRSGRRPGW